MTQNESLMGSLLAIAEIGHLVRKFQQGEVGVPGVIEHKKDSSDYSQGILEGLAMAHFYAKEALKRIAKENGVVVVIDPETLEEINEVMRLMEEEHGYLPDEFTNYLEDEHGICLGDVVICQALLEV